MSESLLSQPQATKPNYDDYALAWESDGTSQKKYCERHGLVYGQFVAAHSKLLGSRGLTRSQSRSHFVEVVPSNCRQTSVSPRQRR